MCAYLTSNSWSLPFKICHGKLVVVFVWRTVACASILGFFVRHSVIFVSHLTCLPSYSCSSLKYFFLLSVRLASSTSVCICCCCCLQLTFIVCGLDVCYFFFIVSRYNSNTTKVHIFLLFVNISTYVFCLLLLLLSPSILCRHVYFLLLNHLLFCSDFFCPMSINAAMTFKTKLKLKKCAYFLHEHEVSKQFMHARVRERGRAP